MPHIGPHIGPLRAPALKPTGGREKYNAAYRAAYRAATEKKKWPITLMGGLRGDPLWGFKGRPLMGV